MLATLDDAHFTTELGPFNLELNLDPQLFTRRLPGAMEAQLDELLGHGPRGGRRGRARRRAHRHPADDPQVRPRSTT